MTRGTRSTALVLFLLAALALLAPLVGEQPVAGRVGSLLVFAGILEGLHGFRRSDPAAQRAAWQSAGISVLIGVLLINATWFMAGALVLLVAGWFAVDAARYAWVGLRGTSSAAPRCPFSTCIGIRPACCRRAIGCASSPLRQSATSKCSPAPPDRRAPTWP